MQQHQTVKRGRGRPPKKDSTHLETKERLLRKGIEILTEKGFSSTGLDLILKETGIPKGSFYHYFENKDAFGLAVIDAYNTYFAAKLDRWLLDTAHTPLERLRDFIEDAKSGMQRHQFTRGCLIGNLGQEVGAIDEKFRNPLEDVFLGWQKRIAACLEEGKEQQEISPHIDSEALAAFFWIGWEGAILRAKLNRSTDPLELFADQFLNIIKQQ